MKTSLLFTFLLGLTACQPHPQTSAFNQGDYKLPFDKWGFVFFTPWKLRALVTDTIVVDTTGRMYRFHTLDATKNDRYTARAWNEGYKETYYFNTVDHSAPPMYMVFCWDSWVDKKHYETSMYFLKPLWQRMMIPDDNKTDNGETYWFDTLLIGLAPGGTTKIWLKGNGGILTPNIPVPTTNMKTLSGDNLNVCKGVSQNVFSREMAPDTAEFIKDKKFPYGNW